MEFPQPEIGLVISYSYLWSDEAEAGHVEGRKNRPCAIVLVVQQVEGKAPVVTVVPGHGKLRCQKTTTTTDA